MSSGGAPTPAGTYVHYVKIFSMHIKCEVQHHRDIWEWGIYGLSGWGIKWVGKVHVCVFKTCAQKKKKKKKNSGLQGSTLSSHRRNADELISVFFARDKAKVMGVYDVCCV